MKSLDPQILRLAVPSIVSNATVPLLGLCDVTIMGHVGGARHIGAIAVGSMIFNVMYWLFGFLRMGTSGLSAQALGARRLDEAATLLRRGLLAGFSMGLIFILLQLPLRHLAFWMMQATDEVQQLTIPYYNICIWGAPPVLGLYALTGWYIGMQNTRTPMLIAVFQNVLNICMSLLLVLCFGMGVEGVALGTIIAQWAGFLASLLILRLHYGRLLHRHRSSWQQLVRGLGRFFRLNLDIFLRTVCLVAVNLYFTSAGAAQGALILAANTLLMQFFMFFSYVMDGFAYAGEALAGRYLGAGNSLKLRQVVRRLFCWGGGVVVVFTLVYGLCGTPILRMLTTDACVIAVGTDYLPWAVLIPVTGVAAFIWDGIFIGTTLTRGMLLSCFWAAVAFFVLRFVLAPIMGNHALWLALLVYLALRGLVQTLLAQKQLL